jgi:hypothetical protein
MRKKETKDKFISGPKRVGKNENWKVLFFFFQH